MFSLDDKSNNGSGVEGQVEDIDPRITQVGKVELSIFSKSSDFYHFCAWRAMLLVTCYEMIFRKKPLTTYGEFEELALESYSFD